MATKNPQDPAIIASYEKAVVEFSDALQLLHKRDYAGAKSAFKALEMANDEEPVLAERARTYARICDAKLAPQVASPSNSEARYLQAVFLANEGRSDEAIILLDSALRDNPASAKFFYARASAFALKGDTESAVNDLRQCIAIDPPSRFQAVNDSDFERIREEPSFIDIIEPTPAGA